MKYINNYLLVINVIIYKMVLKIGNGFFFDVFLDSERSDECNGFKIIICVFLKYLIFIFCV